MMLPHSLSVRAYRKLFLIRESENAIVRYYSEDEMKTPMHMTMGQEASAVGVCLALGDRGQVYCTYRSHGSFLARTENVAAFFAELYGRTTGPARGKAGSMHLSLPESGHLVSSAIVGSCLPLAVGSAFAFRSRGEDKVSCVFFGDGALDEGAFWESINAACVMGLPVLFVCEDNDWAVHTAKGPRAGYESIAEVVRQMRCEVAEAETNDVEEISGLTEALIQRSRERSCPAFLKLKCCRYLEHVGIGCDLKEGYRHRSEVERWQAMDSIRLQRERLVRDGWTEAELSELEGGMLREIEDAVAQAKAAPSPSREELERKVFA